MFSLNNIIHNTFISLHVLLCIIVVTQIGGMSRNASVKSLHKNKSGGITFPIEEAAHVGYRSPEKSGVRGSSRNSGYAIIRSCSIIEYDFFNFNTIFFCYEINLINSHVQSIRSINLMRRINSMKCINSMK